MPFVGERERHPWRGVARAGMKALALLMLLVLTSACDRAGSIEVDGVRLAYQDLGSRFGEPVLLIHGLYKDAAWNWHQSGIVEQLSETHRVVVFDLRGHGESDRPETPEAYGRALADDAIALIDHLGIDRVHLVGFSVGGRVVLRLLAEHPDRAISGALIGMGWHRPHSAELHELRSNRGPAAEALVASLPQLDISEADLAAIQVPFAVWVGARDPVRKDQVIELSRVRPDVPVHVIQKVGHSQILRNGRFQDALADFIDGGYAELAEGR